ncbi:ChaB family protein [Rhodococcus sp. NPDC003348]
MGTRVPHRRRGGEVNRFELPQTLRRSAKEVQEAFATAHETAVRRYGEGEEAQRAAYGELKQSYELETDHWVPKSG